MKKLIFFAKDMELGGLEKALLTLLNSLDYSHFEVTLVLEEKHGELLERLDKRVAVEEYRVSDGSFVPLRKAVNFTNRMLWAAKHKGRYDFACSYCTYSVIGSRLAKYASDNSCLYVHNDYSVIYPDSIEFQGFFDTLQADKFRHIVFVSNESRESFIERCPELKDKALVINNLIDVEGILKMAQEPTKLTIHENKTAFIYIGRLEERQKRISRLLQAFRLARKKRRDIRLIIVGDGPDRDLCTELVNAYGLSECVAFVGAQTNPYKYLRLADCLLLSSNYEGFPVVYYEALVLGKDIITTVPVSDGDTDISDYAVIAEKTPEAVAEAIVNYRRGESAPFDAHKLNAKRLESLYSVILS